MKQKKHLLFTVLSLLLVMMMLFTGCTEEIEEEDDWKANGGDPGVTVKPLEGLTVVEFGSYPSEETSSEIKSVLANVKIDPVTGLWLSYDSRDAAESPDDNNYYSAYYDRQTGYYVCEEVKEGVKTVTRHAAVDKSYYQLSPIKWILLENEGGSALLLSEKVIESGRPFNDLFGSVTWADSTIRDWLNGTDNYAINGVDYAENWNFIQRAFSREEQEKLVSTNIETKDNAEYDVPGGGSTEDKVFLLSIDDIVDGKYFFANDSARIATSTPYAIAKGVVAGSSKESPWWLRTPGIDTYIQAVYRDGSYGNGFSVNDKTVGLRIALRVDVDALAGQI